MWIRNWQIVDFGWAVEKQKNKAASEEAKVEVAIGGEGGGREEEREVDEKIGID